MKSVCIFFVVACLLFDGAKGRSWEVEENITSITTRSEDPFALRVLRFENDLNVLFKKAKENLLKRRNVNLTTVDIIRNLIDTNETGILQQYPESCPTHASFHGIYTVKLPTSEAFAVSCDAQIAGPGWTVIQRRIDGNLNFFRSWSEFKTGFGNVSQEFFIGLDKLHAITSLRQHELYIQLEDFNGEKRYARYDNFRISNEATYFKLESLGSYSGNAGDSLTYSLNMMFTTFDAEHDAHSSTQCAEHHVGAWWHKDCSYSSLNGLYLNGQMSNTMGQKGVYWFHWKGEKYSYKSVQMMVRPKCPCAY